MLAAHRRGSDLNIFGPPESSLMKPKPRSAFHFFKVPVAIALYFPFALDGRPAGTGALRAFKPMSVIR
jgi:hypothetical protein